MEKLSKIYGTLMEKHRIAKIPVLTPEDETAIRKVVTFDQKRDTLIGFCGEKKTDGTEHQCMKDITVVLRNDENTSDLMVSSFNKYDIGVTKSPSSMFATTSSTAGTNI